MKVGRPLTLQFSNKNILIADLPLSPEIIKQLRENNKILIIDHHKTNLENMQLLPEDEKIFDMTKSGAMLMWEYFFSNTPENRPIFVDYIQDRDLWRNSLHHNEVFAAWIRSLKPNPDKYLHYFNDDVFLKTIITIGANLIEYNQYLIESALEQCMVEKMIIDKKEYTVAHVNSTILQSEIGAALMLKYPEADFSYVNYYNDSENLYVYSLRSQDNKQDVSVIAKYYGGGGHRNASGIQSTKLARLGD